MSDWVDQNVKPVGRVSAPHCRPWARLFFGASAARWLVPILTPYLNRLWGLLALGLVAALIGLVPPYLSKLVIDQGLMAGDTQALIYWSGMLFVVGLGAVALGALNNILHMRASVRMLADLRAHLLDALIAKPGHWFPNQRAGELLARVDGDAGAVQQFAFNAVLSGLSSVVRLIGGTTMLMLLNWKLGLAAAVLAPIELAFLVWARPRTTEMAGDVRHARGRLTAGLSEMLHGLGALQLARGTTWARGRSLSDQHALNDQLQRQQLWIEFTRAVPQILSAMMRAGIFVAGGVMVINGDWPLGSLIAFIAYLGFMIGPMQSLLGLWHAQARAKVALGRLDGLMQRPEPRGGVEVNHADLQARDLSYVVPNGAEFGPVDFDLPKGQKLALAGPSGSGKTTLLRLIMGEAGQRSGTMTLGGVNVETLSPEQIHRRVTFVSQRPFVVRASLRENLFLPSEDWAKPETEARVWEVLTALGLSERFDPKEGLDSILGENGLTLSGGERQRICLARALLRDFDILIMDEALSEVDPYRVAQIMAYVDQEFADRTRIITTHTDLTAYGRFDQIVDLGK